jgi:hypothetical protein
MDEASKASNPALQKRSPFGTLELKLEARDLGRGSLEKDPPDWNLRMSVHLARNKSHFASRLEGRAIPRTVCLWDFR